MTFRFGRHQPGRSNSENSEIIPISELSENLHDSNTDATIPKIPKFNQFRNFRNAGRRQRSSSYPKARALGCTVWGAPSRPGFPNRNPAPRGCFPAPPRKGGPTGSQAKNQKLPKTGALSNHFQNSQHPSRNSCNGRAFSFNVLAGIGSRGRESLNIVTTCTTAGRERPENFAARRVTLPRPNNFTVTKQPAITGAQQRTKHPRPSRRRPSPPSGARSKGNLESLAAEPLARLPPLACELAPARTQLHKRL